MVGGFQFRSFYTNLYNEEIEMVSSSDFSTILIVLCSGVLGIINAMVFWTLNEEGIIIDSFVSGSITILDCMVYTIILWLIVGIILSAVKR